MICMKLSLDSRFSAFKWLKSFFVMSLIGNLAELSGGGGRVGVGGSLSGDVAPVAPN